jgi:hypothetical protein
MGRLIGDASASLTRTAQKPASHLDLPRTSPSASSPCS